jgi:hypothetical protein
MSSGVSSRWAVPERATRAFPWALALLAALAIASPAPALAQAPASRASATDEALRMRVAAALERAADVPGDSITVQVSGGVVTLVGSVLCAECGGNATPGGSGTVQQSLGAVVRAVPGVERVEFRLRYRTE